MVSKKDLVGLGVPAQLANRAGYEPETAAGATTASATATVLHPTANFVNVTAASSQTAIRFNDNWPLGQPVFLFNSTATTALIFPPTGGAINGGSQDASVNLAQNKAAIFIRYSTTVVVEVLTA